MMTTNLDVETICVYGHSVTLLIYNYESKYVSHTISSFSNADHSRLYA